LTSVPPERAAHEEPVSLREAVGEQELASQVVLALHRLAKGASLYDADNQAALMQLERARQAVETYGRIAQLNPKIFFTEKSVFVGGRLLRGGRSVYASALELGKMLRRFGIDEVSIGFDVTIEDLRLFQSAWGDALRGAIESPAQHAYQRIRLRKGTPPGSRKEDEPTSRDDLVIRTYATAIIVVRRFLDSVSRSEYRLPIGLRRVAQQVAELAVSESPAVLAAAAMYHPQHDPAGRSVNAALVALAMARQLTEDKRLLARIATGALLYDVGNPRVAGVGPMGDNRLGIAPRLIEEQFHELPVSGATAAWAIGGFADHALVHTALVYESLCLAHRDHAREPYGGLRQPSLAARIITAARAFADGLVDAPDEERSADRVLCGLLRDSREEIERTVLRLIASAIGLFTSGSLVRLSTGDVAEVVRVSDNPLAFSLPTVRPVLDVRGTPIQGAAALDLSRHDAARILALVELGQKAPAEVIEVPPSSMPSSDPRLRRSPPPSSPPRAVAAALALETPLPLPPEPELEPSSAKEFDELEPEHTPVGFAVSGGAYRRSAGRSEPPLELSLDEPEGDLEEPPAAPERRRPATPAPKPRRPSLPAQAALSDPAEVSRPKRTAPKTPVGRRQPQVTPPVSEPPGVRGKSEPTNEFQVPPPAKLEAAVDSKPQLDDALMAYLAEMEAEAAPPLSDPGLREAPEPAPVEEPEPEKEGAPTAEGSLAQTPLPHLLIYALDRRLTGTAVFYEDHGAEHAIYFVDGAPAKVRTADPVWALDEVLREMQVVPDDVLDVSVTEVCDTGELHGAYLLREGHLDELTLMAALQLQVLSKVTYLLGLEAQTTRYAYFDGVNMLEDYGGPEDTPVEPLLIVMRGVRLSSGSQQVHKALARLGTQPLRLRNDADLGRLELEAEEQRVVDLLRVKRMTLHELLARRVSPERVALLTVYALLITRSLRLASQQNAPVGHGRPVIEQHWLAATLRARRAAATAAPPPPALPPLLDEPETDEGAFDGLDDPEPQPFTPPPRTPPPRTPPPHSPAPRTPAPRTPAPRTPPPRTPPPEPARDGASPAQLARRAQLMLVKGAFERAEALAREAFEAEPELAERRALYAWCQAQVLGDPPPSDQGFPSSHYVKQIQMLDDVIEEDPDYARAIFFRAQLLKRSGHTERALVDYQRVVELDPRNAEAAEEVERLSGSLS
jgi:tetratricopeptide (TPR) repeat protein